MKAGELESVLGKIRKGEYDAALLSLHDALGENPRDVDALNLSGFASLYAGDVGLAEGFFDEALAADPHDFVAWGERGRCHLLKGEYEEAAACLEKSSALFDDADLGIKSRYGMLKGYAELNMGEIERSLCSFESACLLNGEEAVEELEEFRSRHMGSLRMPLLKKSSLVLRLGRLLRKFSGKKKG